MLMHMRTTLMLPDDLYRDVNRIAADSGRTVTSVVEEALRAALERHRAAASGTAGPVYRVSPGGSGGLQPGIDLAHAAGLLDLMEDE